MFGHATPQLITPRLCHLFKLHRSSDLLSDEMYQVINCLHFPAIDAVFFINSPFPEMSFPVLVVLTRENAKLSTANYDQEVKKLFVGIRYADHINFIPQFSSFGLGITQRYWSGLKKKKTVSWFQPLGYIICVFSHLADRYTYFHDDRFDGYEGAAILIRNYVPLIQSILQTHNFYKRSLKRKVWFSRSFY